MISRLTYVRHGQSEANARGVYGGALPHLQLTGLGREQAAAAGKLLRETPVDIMLVSPLDRAQETARIIAGAIGYDFDHAVTEPDLVEIATGKLTGQPDLGFDQFIEYITTAGDPEADTFEGVAARVRRVLSYLATEPAFDGKSVLIVAHAGVARVMRSILTGMPLEELAKISVANAAPFDLPLDRLSSGDYE